MTVSSTARKAGPYLGDGSTTVLPFGFRVFSADDLRVVRTSASGAESTLVLGSDYTATLNAAQDTTPGGSITLTTPAATGETTTIGSQVAALQLVQLANNGGFYASVLNGGLDRLTILIQQALEELGRSMRVPFSDSGAGVELPSAAARANTSLAFDGAGAPTVMVPTSGSAADVLTRLADPTSASKGAALVAWSAALSYASGTVGKKLSQRVDASDYASLAAAVAAIGSTPARLVVSTAVTLAANLTIPSTCALAFEQGGYVTLAGYTLTINGPFADPGPVRCWTTAGTVAFGVGVTPYVRPEWWGAKADAAGNGTSGTDCTAALQAALNVPVIPVVCGYGNYLFSNLTMPSEKSLYGAGIHATNFICKTGSTGTMFTDQGSAAKIDIQGIAFYGNNCSYSQGFRLGYGGGSQFGTEGSLDIWVRDLPSGFAGIDINGNVGHAQRLLSQDTGGLQLVGAGWMVDKAQAYGSKGFTASGVTVGCNLQLVGMGALEIEAPASGITPLYLSGNTTIGQLFVAPTAGATYPTIVEIGASCTTWALSLSFFFATGAAPTIANGNFKSGTRYFGGNATGKNFGGEGNYTSENFGQRYQAFTLKVTNSGGTLKHTIATTSGNTTSSASAISGASSTLTTTPTGADNITAMAAGGKIGSAATNTFWFDTRDQSDAVLQMDCGNVLTTGGTALIAQPIVSTLTINGVSRTLFGVQFLNAATGGAVALSSLTAGQYVQVTCSGYMAT